MNLKNAKFLLRSYRVIEDLIQETRQEIRVRENRLAYGSKPEDPTAPRIHSAGDRTIEYLEELGEVRDDLRCLEMMKARADGIMANVDPGYKALVHRMFIEREKPGHLAREFECSRQTVYATTNRAIEEAIDIIIENSA